MNVLSLCAGIGGLDLGLRLARPDARTICYVERESFACAVLVEAMESGRLDPAPVWSDLASFDGGRWGGVVDCIAAGYPCQPFSVAGKRDGTADPRHLWPHIARIIRECKPAEVFLENVPGHLRLGFSEVADELRGMGYRVAAGLVTAEECGAPHQRDRLFALANSVRPEFQEAETGAPNDSGGTPAASPGGTVGAWPPGPSGDWSGVPEWLWPATEPGVRRVADGLPSRVDRLRALGNAVVPVVAAYAYRHLAEALRR